MKRKQHDTFARWAMKLLCSLLALVLVLLLGATALFQQVLGKIHYTQPVADFGTRLSGFVSNLASEGFGTESGLIGGTGSGIVNILLIGQDRREGEETARSDSMILCTYHRKTGNVTMTSFLRDLYVPIPGHHNNRINAAYSEGGAALLDRTLLFLFLILFPFDRCFSPVIFLGCLQVKVNIHRGTRKRGHNT